MVNRITSMTMSWNTLSTNFYLRFTIHDLLDVGHLFNGCDDLFDIWYCCILEILGVGHRHVGAGNTFDWSIEIIKSTLHNFGSDLGRDAAKRMRLFGDDHAISLLY